MNEAIKGRLAFLIEADKMKNIMRRTLVADGSRPENDAEHSWHMALMAMVLYEHCRLESVSLDRVIKMALVHDLVEVYAGDTFAYDSKGYADKLQREKKAADKLFSLLPDRQGREYRSLWEEFDEMKTPDARYAAAVDRLQPFINNCLTQGHTWREGKVALKQVLARMEPVKEALPELWPYVEGELEKAIKKGWLSI